MKGKCKISPIGLVPFDWEIGPLSQFTEKITDGTHDTPKPIKQGVPFLTAIHVKEGFIDFENCYYLDEKTHKEIYKRCNPQKGDVLLVNIGAGVATPALINVEYEFSLKNVALLKPKKNVLDGKYLEAYQIFYKPKLQSSLLNGGAQPFLSLGDIQKLKIVVPPFAEQIKIGKILSTFDKAVVKLSALIEVKEKRKKGLIQNLLTGKVRFKGFAKEKWQHIEFEKVFQFLSNSSFSREKLNYDVSKTSTYYIHYGDIHATYQTNILDFNAEARVPVLDIKTTLPNNIDYLKDGDLIIADASEDYEGVGKCIELKNVTSKKVISGLHTFAVRDYSKKTVPGFRSYLFSHPEVSNDLKKLATGSKVYGISKTNISKLRLHLPGIKEQQKIVSILFRLNQEIEQLQMQLAKSKIQRKGIMQQLLTGKVRVKIK